MGADREHESGTAVVQAGSVLFYAEDRVIPWVSERIPGFRHDPEDKALGIVDDGGNLICGAVYTGFNGVHCSASIAAEPGAPWATKASMFKLFYYPFVTLGCVAMSVQVASSNVASLNLVTKMGFEGEAMIRYAAHDGSTLVVLKMLRENCKWIRRDGQGRRQRTKIPRSGEDAERRSAIEPY